MSGVMAVVMTVNHHQGGHLISDWQVMDNFWSIFGAEFGAIIDNGIEWQAREWGHLFVLYRTALIIFP
jgi:hypothetical protein